MTLPVRDPKRPTGAHKPGTIRKPSGATERRGFVPPPKKSKTGLIVAEIVGGVVVAAIILVLTMGKSPARPAQAPIRNEDPGTPNIPGGAREPTLSAEDKAALKDAFAKETEAEGIYNKTVSSAGGGITLNGPRDQAKIDLERAKELLSQSNDILERLGNKYNYQFGEGTRSGRIMKGINSALRELRQK